MGTNEQRRVSVRDARDFAGNLNKQSRILMFECLRDKVSK